MQFVVHPPAIMEMRFGFWDKAVEKFDKIVDLDSIYGRQAMDYKTAFSLFSSGMSALNAKDISKAKSKLDQLDALFWRNSQLENEKDSINPFRLKTLVVTSIELKGNILIAEKKYDKGIEVLKKAVKMERDLGYSEPPYYPRPVLLSLADAYIENGAYEKADSCYRKMLVKHPNSAMAYWGLMKLYKTSKQQDKYDEIEPMFYAVTQYGDKEIFK